MLADRLPFRNPIREHRRRVGAAGRERVEMMNKVAELRRMRLDFTHHDRSTKGDTFTG